MGNKTIAVNHATWERLKKLMEKENAKDFDQLINILVQKSEELPDTMFGIDRKLKYTQDEHDEFVRD